MVDPRTIVERELGRVDVRPFTLDTFHIRRERRRRNQRLAAGAVGVSIALAIALIASHVAIQRHRTGGPPNVRNGVIAFTSPGGLVLSGPHARGYRIVVRDPADPPGDCPTPSTGGCVIRGTSWAWSPDGTSLAFVYGEPSAGLLGDMSIYVMDAGSERVSLLARCPAGPGEPTGTCDNGSGLSWSPDGSEIVFPSRGALYVVGSATGAIRQITGCEDCAFTEPALDAAWSPSGAEIAFTSTDSLVAIDPAGAVWRTLADGAPFDGGNDSPSEPEWSREGNEIAFATEQGIFAVGADGTELRQLVDLEPRSDADDPSWSADGDRIVYVRTSSSAPSTAEIRVVGADGGGDGLLFRSSCCIDSWGETGVSPDGSMITFSLQVAGGALTDSGVFVMNTDGSDLHRFPGSGDPAWQSLAR